MRGFYLYQGSAQGIINRLQTDLTTLRITEPSLEDAYIAEPSLEDAYIAFLNNTGREAA